MRNHAGCENVRVVPMVVSTIRSNDDNLGGEMAGWFDSRYDVGHSPGGEGKRGNTELFGCKYFNCF